MRKPTNAQQLAQDLLHRSTLPVQMAAVIHKGNRFISWGWNSGWLHAEQCAVSRAPKKLLKGATCTIIGKNAGSGNPVCSRPCEIKQRCLQLLRGMGIAKIEYRNAEGKWVTESLIESKENHAATA